MKKVAKKAVKKAAKKQRVGKHTPAGAQPVAGVGVNPLAIHPREGGAPSTIYNSLRAVGEASTPASMAAWATTPTLDRYGMLKCMLDTPQLMFEAMPTSVIDTVMDLHQGASLGTHAGRRLSLAARADDREVLSILRDDNEVGVKHQTLVRGKAGATAAGLVARSRVQSALTMRMSWHGWSSFVSPTASVANLARTPDTTAFVFT